MFENRISAFFTTSEFAPVAPGSTPAFVACPVTMFGQTVNQVAYVAEVYRRAQELTQSQLRKPVRSSRPEFSMN
ncbi:unnamed protein product [Gemmataceae bacterium]|nr:unnamed protein product [Gemmataceae bacterium]VTT99954.1 unnamed protein product [Gemmataceae bacterium]